MNFKSILSVTLLFVLRVNGQLHKQTSSFGKQVSDKCDLTAGPQCSSDCSRILACVSRIERPILSINCSATTPYCDNGRCVATPGKCTKKANKPPFLCTSSGEFPEPTDCSQSHSCSGVGAQSVISVCPRGKIFDSKSKLCIPRPPNQKNICEKISCDDVTNDFVTFPANPTFYAYCFTSATGVQHTYMYKCDDEINKVFDVITKKCRFNCKALGYYADPMDCSSYYICNGLQFASRHVHCPPTYFFNGTACLNSKAHCPVGSIVNMTTTTTEIPTINTSMADEMPAISNPTTEEAVADATTSPLSESSGTSTFNPTLTDEMSAMADPTTEKIMADTTSHSESSSAETFTTFEPTTLQTVGLPLNVSTKKPSI